MHVVIESGRVTYRGTKADCLTVVDIAGGTIRFASLFQLLI